MPSKIYDFTIQGLRKRLREILDRNYTFSLDFKNKDSRGFAYLRHDVDLSLEHALHIAEEEAKVEITATYFIMLSSPFYNAFSKRGRLTLYEIMHNGHEIGLHFDSSVATTIKSLESKLHEEIDALEQLCGAEVKYFSQHRPTQQGWVEAGHINAIDVRTQTTHSEVKYLSDSTGLFRWGDYSSDLASRRSFQLLLHPIWWTGETPEHPRKSLNRFISNKRIELEEGLEETITNFGLPDGHLEGWPLHIDRQVLS